MTIEELRSKLQAIRDRQDDSDQEEDHIDADNLLVNFIGDEKVSSIFDDIEKWYA